jgi:hypothetical protein
MAIFKKQQQQDEEPVDEFRKDLAWDTIFDESKTGIRDVSHLDLQKGQRKKRLIILVTSVIACIIIVVIGYLVYSHMTAIREGQVQQNQQSVTPSPSKSDGATGSDTLKNPAAESQAVKDAATGVVKVSVNKNEVMVAAKSASYSVQFPSLTDAVKLSSTGCDLSATAANCYIGSAKVNDKQVNLYAVRDVKSNALLYSTESYKVTPSNGSALAFVRAFKDGDKATNALVVVFENQTAVIATSTDLNTIVDIATGDAHFHAAKVS